MKLPFLRTSRAAETQPARAATAPAGAAAPILDDTVHINVPARAEPQLVSAAAQPRSSADIPLAVASILAQLPARLFVPGADAQLQGATIAIPADLVLPQLPTGKVALKLSDLLPLLPADLLQQPPAIAIEPHTVSLPLPELIAAMPEELLALQNEAVIELDDAPAGNFAGMLEAPAPAEPEPAPEPVKQAPARPAVDPAETACFSVPSAGTAPLTVSARSLLAVMPDNVFAAPRAELCRRVGSDARVPVPLDLIKPQLATGHVSLPLATAIEALPASLFTRPLPAIEGKVIPLSVQEIVSQLPADYFADQLQHVRQEVVELDEAGIPAPFQERQAAPPPQPAPEPAPTPVKPEPVAPEMAVAPAALEDENFALFSEKPPESPAPAEAPAQTPPTPDTGFLVDLNRCTEAELLKLHGVGPSLARRIVDYRNQHGRFQSLEELRQVPGMGRKTFRAVTGPDPKKLNRLLRIEHDRELSLQEIVSALAGLRGVEGCILAMDDGLLLTGQLPLPLEPNAVGALAPQLFKKVERYTRELEVGRVRRLTIFTEQKPMSIFQAGNIYLVVVHHARNYSKALLRRCERISQELARMCRKRAVV